MRPFLLNIFSYISSGYIFLFKYSKDLFNSFSKISIQLFLIIHQELAGTKRPSIIFKSVGCIFRSNRFSIHSKHKRLSLGSSNILSLNLLTTIFHISSLSIICSLIDFLHLSQINPCFFYIHIYS